MGGAGSPGREGRVCPGGCALLVCHTLPNRKALPDAPLPRLIAIRLAIGAVISTETRSQGLIHGPHLVLPFPRALGLRVPAAPACIPDHFLTPFSLSGPSDPNPNLPRTVPLIFLCPEVNIQEDRAHGGKDLTPTFPVTSVAASPSQTATVPGAWTHRG